MTRAIADSLHIEIQNLLWNLIDLERNHEKELDYLQVFDLENKRGQQHITHRQEMPERKSGWIISLDDALPVNNTVWCIDDGVYQTMLFPSDY